MTRIKYKLNISTSMYESQPILTGHGSTIACSQGLNWMLRSYDTGFIIISGTAKNSSSLKRILKKELISRGAIFGDEIRNKK